MKVYVLLIVVFISFSCSNNKPTQEKINSTCLTEISFEEEMHDFGKLLSGEIAVYTFVFTNTGKHDFKIKNIYSDCGCVRVDYSTKAVKSGGEGKIQVEFDSSGLMGRQLKTIEIHANCKEPKQLVIFAEVKNEQIEITF